MKRKSANSIDGFVPRNRGRELGQTRETTIASLGESNRPQIGSTPSDRPATGGQTLPKPQSVSRSDVDESLRGIDDETPAPVKKRRGLFRRKAKPVQSTRRKWTKRIVTLLIIVLVAVGGWVAFRAIIAGTNIFKGNLFGLLLSQPLKMDANGRTNILVFGTSGSVDDQRHEGANLTDTIMVLSIDQEKKNAFMVSLPRDLYVDYGQACNAGYQGKINEMYLCYSNGTADDEAGAAALEKKAGEVTGLSIQYYAHVNWAVVVGAVDAVGGVDVDVKGDGQCWAPYEGGVVDANMKIAYSGGKHHMNGTKALMFSRARGELQPNCGLNRGDFDRQLNQQLVLKALQSKALSAGTLTNLGKVTSLIDALGKNLRTSFDTSEIQTLMRLGHDIPSDKITSIDLRSLDNPQIVDGHIANAGSTQVPAAGTFDYSGIHSYINRQINANDITRENAHVALFNGSGVEGDAAKRQAELEKLGFTITAAQNAPAGSYDAVEVFDLSGDKPVTKAKLESLYRVTIHPAKDNPVTVSTDTDFVIIYGKASSAD